MVLVYNKRKRFIKGAISMGMSPLIREYDKLTEQKIEEAPKTGKRNKWVALALCLILGQYGVHKFYEKKFFIGLLYIFLNSLDGFTILIAIILDAIMILTKDTTYYIEKYEFQDVKNSYTPKD